MLKNLPTIDFVDKDASTIEAAILTMYQAVSGRTLATGDPVRLFLETIAAIIIQQRVLIDYSAKQNLLAYATGDYLDHIGVLVGVSRLPAAAAQTTLRFTLSAVQSGPVIIPAGIRAAAGGDIVFEVMETVEIPAGQTFVDALASCATIGSVGNGLEPGTINQIVDPLPWIKAIDNMTISENGADAEADGSLRERIRQAPESFSTAGPDGAYQFWAKSAHQNIIDVSVRSPQPGEVELRPLLVGGILPGNDILAAVDAICNDNKVRPLTDKVTVSEPGVVEYNINLTYYIARDDATTSLAIQSAVAQAVQDYILWQKSKLGRDVNPSELIWRVRAAGASRVEVLTPTYTDVDTHQVALPSTISAHFGGLNDG